MPVKYRHSTKVCTVGTSVLHLIDVGEKCDFIVMLYLSLFSESCSRPKILNID